MWEGEEEGGWEGQPVRVKRWTGKTGSVRASLRPPPPFFSTPFQTNKIFFSRWEKGLPRHTFALFTDGIQVPLTHKLQSH